MFFLSILAHHSEPGDPILMDWIRHQIDAILGFGPSTIVFGLGAVIVLMPLVIISVFLYDRMRSR